MIKAVEEDPGLLEYVPDRFVTEQQIGAWGDDDDYYDDHKLIEWHGDYLKRKAQKAQIKKRVNAYCLAPRSCHGLVYVRRREEAVEVTDSCFKII